MKRTRTRVPRDLRFGDPEGFPRVLYFEPVEGLEPPDEEAPWRLTTLGNLQMTCDKCGAERGANLTLYFMQVCGTTTMIAGRNPDFRHKWTVHSCAACCSALHWSPLNLKDIGLWYPGVEMSVWETNVPWNPA